MTASLTLKVDNYDELRDQLHYSGIFDMLDCEVEVFCHLDASTAELERMITLIESVINVIDVTISIDTDASQYVINVSEVPVSAAEGIK